jgi:hypothetical protein
VETRHTREVKIRKKRGDQACIWGYCSQPEQCYPEHDVAQMALDPLAAIIEAIRGSKYEDTEEYKKGKLMNHCSTINYGRNRFWVTM